MGLQYRAAAAAGVVTQFTWGFMELLVFSIVHGMDDGSRNIFIYRGWKYCL